MNQNILKFHINDRETLIILLKNKKDLIDCCYEAPMILHTEDQNIIISDTAISDYAERLQNKLISALSNTLQLDSSIIKNIGYYWNQYLNEENPDISYFENKDGRHWVGINSFLWGTKGGAINKFGLWLYNDKHDNIIFEVTPTYPETFIDPEDPAEVAAYKTWIKTSYKLFFTRIIPHEVAQQWLDQTNEILKVIEDNE